MNKNTEATRPKKPTRTGHTPEPWYSNTKPDSLQGLIYEESTGKNVAVSYDPKDAPLIAAAPKLLKACRAALDDSGATLAPKVVSLICEAISEAEEVA